MSTSRRDFMKGLLAMFHLFPFSFDFKQAPQTGTSFTKFLHQEKIVLLTSLILINAANTIMVR